MRLRKPHKPSFPSNATRMLGELSKVMSPEQKRAWAAKLDLQEPIAGLVRYAEDSGNGGGNIRGQIEGISTIGWLIRHGDRDFIDGALSGPRAKEPHVYQQGRDFAQINESVDRAVLKEALGMADIATLKKADEVWGMSQNHFIHSINLHGRVDFGSAVYCLANSADSHGQKEVSACVDWILEKHDHFVDTMHVVPQRESAKSKAERQSSQERSKAGARSALMMAACDAGSEKLAKSLLDAGAVPSWPSVVSALSNGAPALAEILWKGVLAKPHPTEDDGEWARMDSSIISKGSNEATALSVVALSLDSLDASFS